MSEHQGVRSVRVERVEGARRHVRDDAVVIEEPLEIRVCGDTLAVTMRTPGHDRELVLGFLWAEGVIRSPDDVSSIAHCGRVGDEARGNTIEVTLASGVRLPACFEEGTPRRGTVVTSACGVCGRRSIDDLLARCEPLPERAPIAAARIVSAVASLRDGQPTFAATGGCHAAALVDVDTGASLGTFEDVGRHNAVDKVIGSRVRAGAMPLSGALLVVSGRASFEIVQKAIAAGVPAVAAVSAASSLAIELARRANVTLAGSVREGAMTVYSGRVE